jgi:hypothetical protein
MTLFSVADWSITQLCLNPWLRFTSVLYCTVIQPKYVHRVEGQIYVMLSTGNKRTKIINSYFCMAAMQWDFGWITVQYNTDVNLNQIKFYLHSKSYNVVKILTSLLHIY